MNIRKRFILGTIALLLMPVLVTICHQSKSDIVSLHDAVQQDNIELVASLLKVGSDVHEKNDKEQTVLELTLKLKLEQGVEIAKLLIQAGADLTQEDKDGYTPIQKAIKTRQVAMVELFILSGSDINYQNDENGFTLLHQVIYQSAVMVVKHYLKISQCGSCLVKKYPKDLVIAQLLTQLGADSTIKNKQGHTVVEMLDCLFAQINPDVAGIVVSEYNYFDTEDIIVPASSDMDLQVKNQFAELANTLIILTEDN